MRRAIGAFAVLVLLAFVAPASALITATTPLADMIDASTFAFTATVQEVDPKRPSMILKLDESLKGKVPFQTMPVLLQGDDRAVKEKEPPQLLKRVAPKLSVVVFASKAKGKRDEYVAWGYTNGTWFGMRGVMVDKEWRWAFLHLEIYLRKTFKGTTAEMVRAVKDTLEDPKKAPKPDEKEKPGIGPEVSDTKNSPPADDEDEHDPRRRGVVAPILVGGPLMILAMLFPTAFGNWKRWLALLSIGGTNSTLYTLHWWFSGDLPAPWGSTVMLWAVMGAVNVLGVGWAWQRHLALVQTGDAPGKPGRIETLVLCVLSLFGLGILAAFRLLKQSPWSEEALPVVASVGAVWFGCAYVVYARLRPRSMTPAIATEAVVLTGLVVAGVLLGTNLQGASAGAAISTVRGEQQTATGERVEVAWKFRVPAKGMLASSPLVAGDRVYVAAAHLHPFSPYGALYCVDRATGKQVWKFDDEEEMKMVYSSPVLVNGKLYVGEGFHTDKNCRLYCIDAATGKKLWHFATTSHTESTPVIVDGRLYVGAGDDGVYCLDAEKGEKLWHFPGFHVDAPPRVVGGHVYAGCGEGDVYTEKALLCLDAKTGKLVRRMGTDLPVWGRPVVAGGFVYAGTGNGRVNEPADRPAGKMLCLREKDGEIVWQKKYDDGILASIVADRRNVYFGCRDGGLYALRRRDGALAWRVEMGSPVVSTPATEGDGDESPSGRLYAAAFGGRLACVDSRSGKALWSRELAALSQSPVEVSSSPALELGRDGDGSEVYRLYVAVTLVSTGRVGELICFEDRTQHVE